jgi:hypothetical protein
VRIERIAVGDIVLCSIGGRRIYGEVAEIKDGVVHFKPLSTAAGWRHASAREIVGHWRRTGRPRPGSEVKVGDDVARERQAPPRGQLSLPLHS